MNEKNIPRVQLHMRDQNKEMRKTLHPIWDCVMKAHWVPRCCTIARNLFLKSVWIASLLSRFCDETLWMAGFHIIIILASGVAENASTKGHFNSMSTRWLDIYFSQSRDKTFDRTKLKRFLMWPNFHQPQLKERKGEAIKFYISHMGQGSPH